MVRIRLRRVGAKRQPSYRVVVADQESPRDGRFIEIIGAYNPRTEPATISVDEGRALHWLGVGAQPTEPVARILKWSGTMERFARLKNGEDLAGLLSEAEAAAEARTGNPRTRRDDLAAKGKSKKKKAAEEAATQEAAA